MKPAIMELPTYTDDRGTLVAAESWNHLPFDIARAFWLYNVNAPRGGHAHRTCQQFLVAVAGSLRVWYQADGASAEVVLEDPGRGLYVPPGVWLEMRDFAPGTVCLVLCSEPYNEDDYL